MSVATEIQRLQAAKADIKTAIEEKGVTVPSATKLDGYADLVDQIQQGGGQEEDYMDDVIFIDYDGKVLYRYTAQEFLALTEMPANPEREGFTAQGWNWTLTDAKAYVTECGMLVIGQIRIATDGKTRLYITLDDANHLTPYVRVERSGTVDWGDGSPIESNTGIGTISLSHTYASTGDYIITLTGGISNHIIGGRYYYGSLKKIHLGYSQSSFENQSFQFYTNLEEINIPSSLTSFNAGQTFDSCINLKSLVLPRSFDKSGNGSFGTCNNIKVISLNKLFTFTNLSSRLQNLRRYHVQSNSRSFEGMCNLSVVSIPNSITSLSSSHFSYCLALKKLYLSNAITTIPTRAFEYTLSLNKIIFPNITSLGERAFQGSLIKEVSLPNTITSIGNYCFYNASSLTTLYVKATTPPTAGTGFLTNASSLTHIYVPSSSVEAYKTATNWNTCASKIEAEPTT